MTRERIYIETMQQILSSTSKILVDTKSSGNLLYLPLDKLMQQAGAPAGSSSTAPAAAETTPASTPSLVDARSREGQRNRDREVR